MGQVNSCLIINQVCFVAFAHLPTVWTNQIMTQCPANVYEPVNSQKQHKACFSSFSSCFLCKNNLQCCLCVKQSHQTDSLRWVFNNSGSIRGLKCPEKRSLSVPFTVYFVLFLKVIYNFATFNHKSEVFFMQRECVCVCICVKGCIKLCLFFHGHAAAIFDSLIDISSASTVTDVHDKCTEQLLPPWELQ